MLKKPDVLEKNKFHIRVQHLQIYQNQIVLSLSFFLCCTVLPITLTTRKPKPHEFDFANQLKCITQVKLRDFVLKVATSGLHLTFY